MSGSVYRIIAITLLSVLAGGLVLVAVALLVRGDDNAPVQVLGPGAEEMKQPSDSGSGAASKAGSQEAAAWVYISGAVHQPEVYQVQPGDRLVDVLKAAGGATEDADLERVNLAQRVQDGQHYHIPRVGEQPPSALETGGGSPQWNAAALSRPGNNLIDLNTAPVALLDTLPGIGPVKARAIVDYREKNGPFQSVEEVTEVSGIGPATYEKIRDLTTVGHQP